ncbi:glycosyltransferase family 4 protein [Ferruginibacter sp.]|nr:glycosyltransferase family 4 protein [Ferruginibacter sp.]
MKKVLVDMHRLGKNKFNGLYIYSYHIGQQLIKKKPGNISLFYYLPKDLMGFFGNGVQYIIQKSLDKFFHRKALGFDIWHSTTTLSWYMPASKKTKFIFTLHDINFLIENPEEVKSNNRNLKLIQQRINRADHIIAISHFALQQARQHLQLGSKPATVIYNGCTYITIPPKENEPAYQPSVPFLFSIGLVQKRKNFHTIIPLLKNNNYQYIIAGIDNYDYKQIILAEAAKYNVNDRVIFTGPVTEEEKVWYYKHCLAFMFPSFAEGFGLPVVEAMYFGKPVFISKETSLPEVGGDVAYYFSSFEADTMIQVFNDGMAHYNNTHPQQKIQQQAGKFSFETAAEEIYRIYETL